MSVEKIRDHSPTFAVPMHIVRPVFPSLESFAEAFRETLIGGSVTNGARWVCEFERQLSAFLNVPTLTFCNGQTALLSMLRAAGVQGGEVIVPSFTFVATPNAVRWCGAEPVFADVNKDGLTIDPEDVERKITSRTVAILGVDAYGVACDYGALEEIGRRKNIKVLFDSAAAFGTLVSERQIGGFGDAQIFSFHATKSFTTMEGGCLCSHDPVLLDRAIAIRNFGQIAGGDCAEPGLNGKLTEVCALIGLEQLKGFEAASQMRRRAVAQMQEGLGRIDGLTIARAPFGQNPIWLYLPVFVDGTVFGLDRDALAVALQCENLFVRKYYCPPCHKMSAYISEGGRLPYTEKLADMVLALPVFNDMTSAECEKIVESFLAVKSRL
ncbi:DegT/DnrJ/EryC1/StrS family aminotransferase [Methylobacterium sp. GC_Met_2]|uniref:DegT/DnrJ/EryC1/StrS family aminotransferase n=1 Tax=Methylobacterium sp. GC_Met_2 TaxID=2937376 RepID=UPI00226B0557|nr:DegT/DnrJ/EryC1/StrS family aminotransferase [Methylobacterium sp. GC_Met_2]